MHEAAADFAFSRRSLLLGAAMGGAWQTLAADLVHGVPSPMQKPAERGNKLKVSMFSKHLHFLSVAEAAVAAKDMGFDALDLTVRPDGHVLPENVARDLPKAVDAIHKAGLEIEMITTEITPDNLAAAESILKTASQLGIHRYRWGGLKYNAQRSIPEQLEAWKPKVRALAELNKRIGTCGMYHTHSGPGLIGACIWDVWLLMRDLDPQHIGLNYDIGHATVEGGYGGWIATSRLSGPHMRGIALKDFLWGRNEKSTTEPAPRDKSHFEPQWCAIDGGMVRFGEFFAIVREQGFSGPVQLHIEYPLGGAENGKRTLTMPRERVLEKMHGDLQAVRAHLVGQGLA